MPLLATQITDALTLRLSRATAANGYATDIGRLVRVAVLSAQGKEAPSVLLVPGEEQTATGYAGLKRVQRRYQINAYLDVRAHPAETDAALVDLLTWDLRRLIEATWAPAEESVHAMAEQVQYRGASPGYREDGGNIIGATLSYDITYAVDLAAPDTAL